MVYQFESQNASVREETSPKTNYSSLKGDDNVIYDLVIVWWGITGLSAAWYAQQEGLKVAVIDKLRIVQWTTWGTTAKLSAQHYFVYHNLLERRGRDVAQAYADANMHGIDEIERIAQENDIDADFSRRPAYIFSQEESKVAIMHQEAKIAQSLWLSASVVQDIELPYKIAWALKFDHQAQFHPRKYLIPLAQKFVENGGVIYENTEATDLKVDDPVTVLTKHWSLQAKHVLQACTAPVYWHELFEGRYWNKVSYGLAIEMQDGFEYPEGMYLRTDDDIRTTRTMPLEWDKQRLIFWGASHNADDRNPDPRYEMLEKEAHKLYPIKKIHYRWLADDVMPYDKIPFIGLLPEHDNVYVATWFRARWLARGVAAAEMVVKDITGNPDSTMKYFSPSRLLEPLRKDDKNEEIGY